MTDNEDATSRIVWKKRKKVPIMAFEYPNNLPYLVSIMDVQSVFDNLQKLGTNFCSGLNKFE